MSKLNLFFEKEVSSFKQFCVLCITFILLAVLVYFLVVITFNFFFPSYFQHELAELKKGGSVSMGHIWAILWGAIIFSAAGYLPAFFEVDEMPNGSVIFLAISFFVTVGSLWLFSHLLFITSVVSLEIIISQALFLKAGGAYDKKRQAIITVFIAQIVFNGIMDFIS